MIEELSENMVFLFGFICISVGITGATNIGNHSSTAPVSFGSSCWNFLCYLHASLNNVQL